MAFDLDSGLVAFDPERMKPLPGFPDYLVRDDGAVLSFKSGEMRVLRPTKDKDRRRRIQLWRDGERLHLYVSYCVALAFIGPRPAGHDVDHIDKNCLNDRASNLRYLPTSENRAQGPATSMDRVLKTRGRYRKGSLTADEVVAIRTSGECTADLAKRYGKCKSLIRFIRAGSRWGWLPS